MNQDNFFRSFDASLIMSIEESRILIFNVLNTSDAYNFFLWHVYISRKTWSFWLALLLWTLRWLLCAINFYRILNYVTKVFTLSVLILKNKKNFSNKCANAYPKAEILLDAICKIATSYSAICKIKNSYQAIGKITVFYRATCKIAVPTAQFAW